MNKYVIKYTLSGRRYAQLVEAYTFNKACMMANDFVKLFEGAELVEVRRCPLQ